MLGRRGTQPGRLPRQQRPQTPAGAGQHLRLCQATRLPAPPAASATPEGAMKGHRLVPARMHSKCLVFQAASGSRQPCAQAASGSRQLQVPSNPLFQAARGSRQPYVPGSPTFHAGASNSSCCSCKLFFRPCASSKLLQLSICQQQVAPRRPCVPGHAVQLLQPTEASTDCSRRLAAPSDSTTALRAF